MGSLIDASAAHVLESLERLHREEEAANIPLSDRAVRCVSRAAAEVLYALVLISRPAVILELGTSLGYSTIWLASAARRVGARVVTVERSASKIARARRNLDQAGVAKIITIVEAEVPAAFAELSGEFDFVFVDVNSNLYADIFKRARPLVNSGGLMFFDGFGGFDNWSTHSDLIRLSSSIEQDEEFDGMILPLAGGFMLAVRTGAQPR